MKHINYLAILLILLPACSSNEIAKKTLRDIDVVSGSQKKEKVFIKPKTSDDIRKAYSEYLKHASKNDKSRLDAINRLAELEFELSNKSHKENDNLKVANNDAMDDKLYSERLEKTIELLSTSLKDYPNAKGNDKVLYQLAKAYDHIGDNKNSEKTLATLVRKYPKSLYYIESQFRLGEIYFSRREYTKAEDTYTDIIGSPRNNVFYEKALFKRGWARFKQEYYLEAVDDHLGAIEYHNFDDYTELNQPQKEQFNEYFRAVGLSFSYLGGAEPLNEYFDINPSFRYKYYSYLHVSNIYLKQQRYSDAVETLKYFISKNKSSKKIPESHLKIVSIWKEAGFAKKAIDEIEILYSQYNPENKYWLSNSSDRKVYKNTSTQLKDNILLASGYFHKLFRENRKANQFIEAKKWYQRYLTHYKSQVFKDHVYYQFASLLSDAGQYNNALKYFELSAFDGDIILNKKSAYASIVLSDKIYKKAKSQEDKNNALNKHVKYASLYTQLYPNDKNSAKIILHAAELAFQTKQFDKTIELAESIITSGNTSSRQKAGILVAHSYFNLSQYENAESAYSQILGNKHLSKKNKTAFSDKLALSIYKQAEKAENSNRLPEAIALYSRISEAVPRSLIAATGLYDGIALLMTHKQWNQAIEKIKRFQKFYPNHKYSRDITKKLSVAYLNSNQGIKAAQTFEEISGFEKDKDVKIAALWQAAELYESRGDTASAIRSYEKYAKKYKKPFPQMMEAMSKVTELYHKSSKPNKVLVWNREIIKQDKKAAKKFKTDRTRFIVSTASLQLAESEHQKFTTQKLVLPLKLSLRKKKYAMQKAVKYYGQASRQGIADTATQSTHAIAEIYKSFSKSLLTSERPKGLNPDELEQYVILLEDKAFPFEDKAIEFYEANMSHIKDGIYNKWIKSSHEQLKELFPARYNRKSKVDRYINVLH